MKVLSYCLFLIFSFNSWPETVDKSLILAERLNQGLTDVRFRNAIIKHASTSALAPLALNHLKAKHLHVLAYSRGEYFCYRYLYVRECWRSLGENQIQFLGNGQRYRLTFRNKVTDLAEAVSYQSVNDTSARFELFPRAFAQDRRQNEFEINLLTQLDALKSEVDRRFGACARDARNAQSRGDAITCVRSRQRDLNDLMNASNKTIIKELARVRASMMIYTQAGWADLKKESSRALLQYADRNKNPFVYECGSPVPFDKFTIEPSEDVSTFKVRTKGSETYVTTFASSADLDLNKCDLNAHSRWPWESCLNANAFDKIPRPVYDSCRILEFSCQPKPPFDVLYVGQCDTPECRSLKPLRSNVQNAVALAHRSGIQNDLRESLFEIQDAMLVAEGLSMCCGSLECRRALMARNKIVIKDAPPDKELETLPRPNGKSDGVKEQDL